jgi:hypothetical protein
MQKILHKLPAVEASNTRANARVESGKKSVQPSIIIEFITEWGFAWVSCSSPSAFPLFIINLVDVS